METANDSIKYIRPVYTRAGGAHGQDDPRSKLAQYDLTDARADSGTNAGWDQGVDYRRAMYESTESRYASELMNAFVEADKTAGTVKVTFDVFQDSIDTEKGQIPTAFGKDGIHFIPGTTAIFLDNTEKQCLAFQAGYGHVGSALNMGNKTWYYGGVAYSAGINPGVSGTAYKVTKVETEKNTVILTVVSHNYFVAKNGQILASDAADAGLLTDVADADATGDGVDKWVAGAPEGAFAFGRYDSESDLGGQYLGQVELVMQSYQFRPRPVLMGVTWTELTELVLQSSFSVSAEEMLMDAAAQEIKKTLDYSAIKFANAAQRQLGEEAVTFDAEAGADTKDSYFHTAQLIGQAISRVGDYMLNDIGRGGVTNIVGGPSAVNYLMLNKGFTETGAQPRIGGHQVGELNGENWDAVVKVA